MSRNDILYAALRSVRNELSGERTSARLGKLFFDNAAQSDIADCAHRRCIIEEDWIEKIESTLPHIEKAIAQQRRNIKKEGEVLRIDRAKRTDKESIRHLAKHSNLLSEITDDGHILPERIYVTENSENYMLYENRFLYTLLVYVKAFVDVRYTVIVSSDNSEYVKFNVQKNVKLGSKSISVTLQYHEEGKEDTELSALKETNPLLYRLEVIRITLDQLLDCDLMRIMSTAAEITPPVVRTNIIKMDRHFAECFELFSFITAYERDGYEITDEKNMQSPPSELTYRELAELCALSAFAVRKNAYGMEEELEEEYRRRERERIEAEERERLSRISEAEDLYGSGKMSAAEYVEILEARLNDLSSVYEAEKAAHAETESEKERLKTALDTEREQKDYYHSLASEREEEIGRIVKKNEETVAAVIERWKEKAADERASLTEEYEKKLERASEEADRRVLELNSEHERKVDSICDEYNSRLHALREIGGVADAGEDFSTREGMELVIREKQAFMRFYNRHWSKAKKNIRRNILWKKKDKK